MLEGVVFFELIIGDINTIDLKKLLSLMSIALSISSIL